MQWPFTQLLLDEWFVRHRVRAHTIRRLLRSDGDNTTAGSPVDEPINSRFQLQFWCQSQGMVASTAPTIPADAVGALDAATVDARASVIVNRAFLLLGEGEPEIRSHLLARFSLLDDAVDIAFTPAVRWSSTNSEPSMSVTLNKNTVGPWELEEAKEEERAGTHPSSARRGRVRRIFMATNREK
uniref:Uncharacterized protein n=1 Tax=Pristionchus pacificus TaxID=54126 RepID=A0A2A6C707_PRIPA|eukprot:PDM73897.1 hypothetical protein PRIPAC_41253 [Pristionchus pacificus]